MAPQKARTKSSGKSQEEAEENKLQDTIESLSDQNRQLMVENYMNSLANKKTFRLELLQSLAKINLSLESLGQIISSGLSQELEEETPKEEEVKKEDKEEIKEEEITDTE